MSDNTSLAAPRALCCTFGYYFCQPLPSYRLIYFLNNHRANFDLDQNLLSNLHILLIE